MAINTLKSAFMAKADTTELNAITEPIDKSIPPEQITNVIPMDKIIYRDAWSNIFFILLNVKKCEDIKLRIIIIRNRVKSNKSLYICGCNAILKSLSITLLLY